MAKARQTFDSSQTSAATSCILFDPAANREVTVKDSYLADVLAGRATLLFDGGMGTLLQAAGLSQVASPADLLSISHPQEIAAIQRRYVDAGSQVITTNTFNANRLKLNDQASVGQVYKAAAAVAREAGASYVAGDIGPTGALLEPMGTMPFEEAYDIFAEQALAAEAAGCDLIIIETMSDLREAKAAVLAAVENTNLPVFATMTFGEDGRTFLGTLPHIAAATLSGLGASAVGINCSLGPDAFAPLVADMVKVCTCPIIAQPNAGLPKLVDGETIYDITPEAFSRDMSTVLDAGATIVGGCCGTNPQTIAAVAELLEQRQLASNAIERSCELPFMVASAQESVILPRGEDCIAVIGERINPTGKKRLARALREGDFDYLVGEAVSQREAGADILDVNCGLADIDEATTMAHAVEKLQATLPTPLQIDSADPVVIERVLRTYPGIPLVNSVNGKESSLSQVLPLVAKYGCSVVGLTLDEGGIPATAEERFSIAQRIVERASELGIPRSRIAIDCLVMAAATNQREVMELLRAVSMVKQQLGVRTVLGVSNVSFGLPRRPLVNATFLAAAFGAGLDMPILNPLSERYMDTVRAFRLLNGQDEGAVQFVATYADTIDPYDREKHGEGLAGRGPSSAQGEGGKGGAGDANARTFAQMGPEDEADDSRRLFTLPELFKGQAVEADMVARGVLTGQGAIVAQASAALLETHSPLDLVNYLFIPALDVVGSKYERGEFFLPQLMASAEAVKAGFDLVREKTQESADDAIANTRKGPILVATVEGDIHDIGKNIAKMILENYGFDVIDLGKDVPPAVVVKSARENNVRLIGLSALMTTTVKAMEETVRLVHEQLPGVEVMVAGAVVTPDYAQRIGADYYAKDAAESARIATKVFG